MDALDRLAPPGADLLSRVDQLLTVRGAPAGHALWPLLRRLRTLPGDAAAAIAALRAEPFAAAGIDLRGEIPEYDAVRAALTVETGWAGAAGEAFDAQRRALVDHLGDNGPGGEPGSLRGRLVATAGYADAVADWVAGTRAALARTLAEVLGSAEAVTVLGQPLPPAGAAHLAHPAGRAAAEIGARVLATVAAGYDDAEELLARWRPALAEAPYRAPSGAGPAPEAAIRLGR